MTDAAAVTDQRPTLDQLLRRDVLERLLRPFLAFGCDGLMLFDTNGTPFCGAMTPSGPLTAWEQLPPEALAAGKGGKTRGFGQGEHMFEVRPAHAGADRVGLLVFSAPAHSGNMPSLALVADALTGVVSALLQAGFATWVTSELHLAASESSYQAIQQRNAELERAVDHLRELDGLKSNFLATVSHELRTPLTAVIGFSEMLLQGIAGDVNNEQREYLQTILERAGQLLSLITSVLEMSHMESGAMPLDLAPSSLGELVEAAISTLLPTAQRANVVLEHHLDEVALPLVLCDAEKIARVLLNLLGNAIKFTRPGGRVSIAAELAPIRRPFKEETFFGEEVRDALCVVVSDTGIGVPSEQIARIFDAFYQVDASPTREHGGAGLGLSIVKNLVTAHGGDIWAESALGVGTSFYFTLPLAQVPC